MITLSAIVGLSTLLLIHSSRSLRNSEIAIPIFLDRHLKRPISSRVIATKRYRKPRDTRASVGASTSITGSLQVV